MLAIDIGTKNIKIVEVNIKNLRVEIKKLLVKSIPEFTVDDDQITNRKAFHEVITQMLKENKLKGDFNYIFSSPQVIIRDIDNPECNKKELENEILRQVEETLPGVTQTSIIDYRFTKKDKIMVCIAPKLAVTNFVDALYETGIKVKNVDTMSNCIRKAFSNILGEDGTHAVIDIGHTNTDITIVKQGEIELHKSFSVGGRNISMLIAEHYGVSLEEAEDIKKSDFRGYDVVYEDRERYLRLCFEDTAAELKKIFSFFNLRIVANSIPEVTLIGGGALYPGISLYFQEMLEIPVKLFKATDMIRLSDGLNPNDLLYFLPAIGASIREE